MDKKYQPVPFWSWNSELEENKLVEQINWMNDSHIGGFFMHARGGLTTPYLGDKWFSCIKACLKRAKELGMYAYAYDENGWPSGFAGGKLLEKEEYRDCYLKHSVGNYDPNAFASYDISTNKLVRVFDGNNVLNVYCHTATSTADILNKDVVKKFIEITHEKYKEADIYGNLKGFFTDEPQYQRWASPYTHCLEDYFKEKYNEDIKDQLGLLFVEKDGYRTFRYKFWKAMQDLMLNSYSKQVYEWCDKNNYIATGHYIEESNLTMQMENCGGIMPYYQYEHIPGMDWLGRNIGTDLAPKQVGSVSAQLGRKQILTETFAMVGWDATPEELKHIFEWQAVTGGISLLCHHLLPYSEKGQRKRDYPEHFSNINPWVEKDFKEFNDMASNISEIISTSHEIVNIGVLHPIRSCYFNYKRDDAWGSINELNNNINEVVNKLGALHIPYHFLDETILSEYGKVDGKSIKVGLYSYDYLILPLIYTMDKNTEKMIHEYANNGGRILLLNDKPSYIEGEEYSYDYLKSNISLDEIIKNIPFSSSENPNIRINYREDDNDKHRFFYIVNLNETTSFSLNGHNLSFKKWESRIINESDLTDDLSQNKKVVKLNEYFKVNEVNNNFMTIDSLKYSKDGKSYSDLFHHMGVFSNLLKERYQGDLYLKYEFNVKDIPSVCSAIIEDQNIINVFINDHLIENKKEILQGDALEFDIAKYIKSGLNEIMVRINFYQSEAVYYALFGENVTETLINCLTYPTTIEAIYLKGNFGVFGDIKKGNEENTYLGKDFYLGKQKNNISSLILDGFPFFRGKIELEQEIELDDSNAVLSIPGRFAMIELEVNGGKFPANLFEHEIDISNYAKKGKNKIKIVLTVSNRNLLGPFHQANAEEPVSVGPHSFERRGTWENGKSNFYRDSYSFVKTIL